MNLFITMRRFTFSQGWTDQREPSGQLKWMFRFFVVDSCRDVPHIPFLLSLVQLEIGKTQSEVLKTLFREVMFCTPSQRRIKFNSSITASSLVFICQYIVGRTWPLQLWPPLFQQQCNYWSTRSPGGLDLCVGKSVCQSKRSKTRGSVPNLTFPSGECCLG